MRVLRLVLTDAAALAAGIGMGVWTSLMTYAYCPGGPRSLGLCLLAPRFAVWQSALIGLGTLVELAAPFFSFDPDYRAAHIRFARWLEHDLMPT